MRRILIPILAAGLACNAQASSSEPAPDTDRDVLHGGPADTLVVSSDPVLREMAAAMLPQLARRSGLRVREPVRLERRSRDELEAYLRFKLDEELSPDRARNMTAAYARLGMMEPDTDLRALLLSVYREQVAGFYDPDSTALFVLDDQGPEVLEPVLLHELVHAVQDQWTDLEALTDPARENDRIVAAQAAVEGHATLVMMEFMMEGMQGGEVDLVRIPGFSARLRDLMARAGDQYPALAAAPLVVREGLLYPYVEGAGFVLAAWQAAGDREGGLEAILPSSTEQVSMPSRFLDDPVDAPTSLTITVDSAEVLYSDNLGYLETGIFLEELAGPEARKAATGWDGDRYLLVRDASGGEALVWASVWDSIRERDRFLATVSRGLDALGPDASVEAVPVGRRPGVLLTVGDAPTTRVELAGAGS